MKAYKESHYRHTRRCIIWGRAIYQPRSHYIEATTETYFLAPFSPFFSLPLSFSLVFSSSLFFTIFAVDLHTRSERVIRDHAKPRTYTFRGFTHPTSRVRSRVMCCTCAEKLRAAHRVSTTRGIFQRRSPTFAGGTFRFTLHARFIVTESRAETCWFIPHSRRPGRSLRTLRIPEICETDPVIVAICRLSSSDDPKIWRFSSTCRINPTEWMFFKHMPNFIKIITNRVRFGYFGRFQIYWKFWFKDISLWKKVKMIVRENKNPKKYKSYKSPGGNWKRGL